MGNCQAIDAAALVIQHPCGRIERLYWTVSAGEVMRMNPGHYVSLIIPLPIPQDHDTPDNKTVRFTRVKLLRPTDTLVLGHAYRLITSQGLLSTALLFSCPRVCYILSFSFLFLYLFIFKFGLSGYRGYEGAAGKEVCEDEEEPGGISREVTGNGGEAEFKL